MGNGMSKILNGFGIAVLLIALLTGMAGAATSGVTDIGATLSESYAIIAPGAVTEWALGIGANSNTTATAGSVSSNVDWTVTVMEDEGDGKLASASTPLDTLTNEIHALSEVGSSYDVTMSGAEQSIATGVAGDDIALDIDYSQYVISSDPQHNDYSMILTYTVSATPP